MTDIVHGAGAWYVGNYRLETPRLGALPADPTDPQRMVNFAIQSFKKELEFHGYSGMTTDGLYGQNVYVNVVKYQEKHGLKVDGQIGPLTARRLFKKRVYAAEKLHSVPNHLVYRQWSLESGFDPAAIGWVDPADHGLNQVHLPFHPEVTEQDSTDGEYMAEWSAAGLAEAANDFHGDWECALAAYNVGTFGAHEWQNAGKPSVGGTADNPTLFATAYHYVVLVEAQKIV